ncbi:MAG: KpsF/GutQ family protein [Parcubacteria group bacterium GW2011_GWA2_47_8b]|nr:MAG: KpsF/GutQ family protein [Parcubacteria group bacterium GW2011_GWA2_47_8b]
MKQANDFKNSSYIVQASSSLQEAMEVITANHRGSAVAVDDKLHVVGVVTDGMIRRALLKGAVMQTTPVSQALNYNAITIPSRDTETLKNPEKFFLEHWEVNVVPVVDEKNALVDIMIRNANH